MKPNPGSKEAVEQGCTCPVLDNAHGKGIFGLGEEWWITDGCPLHAPKDGGKDETEHSDGK